MTRENNRSKQKRQSEIQLPPGEQIEGRNPLEEALRAGRKIRQLYILNKATKTSQTDPLSLLAQQTEATELTFPMLIGQRWIRLRSQTPTKALLQW